MKKRTPCFVCALAVGVLAAFAPTQAKSHDSLAQARAKARLENQRVLLVLTGGDEQLDKALSEGLARPLGKLLRSEYRVVALPAASLPGTTLCKRLGLTAAKPPLLAVLDKDDKLLGSLDAEGLQTDGKFSAEVTETFLRKELCTPLDARAQYADALAIAKKSKRDVFVYLSAPR